MVVGAAYWKVCFLKLPMRTPDPLQSRQWPVNVECSALFCLHDLRLFVMKLAASHNS